MAIVINGSGTVTGISVGGLPDDIVDAGTLADNAVGLAQMAGGTDGNIITYDTSGNPAVVATGSAGQVLTSAGADAVPTMAAGGKVVQVVNSTSTSTVTSTSSTLADTGLTATITPTSASNSILVSVHQSGLGKDTGDTRIGIACLRDATNIGWATAQAGYTASTATSFQATASFQKLDSPSTTSATVYKTQIKSYADTANAYCGLGSPTSSITLMEIAS